MALPGYMQDISKVYGAALPDSTRNDILGAVGAEQFMSEEEKKKRAAQQAGSEKIGQPLPYKASGMKKGGKVSSASKRADGCAQRGKTRGKMV